MHLLKFFKKINGIKFPEEIPKIDVKEFLIGFREFYVLPDKFYDEPLALEDIITEKIPRKVKVKRPE